MVPENKQNRRYKEMNFIGLQNTRHPSQHTVGNVHKASGNCQQRPLGLPPCGGNPATSVTAVLRSIPKGAFADSFQKLYERCQPCVVKDGDYFEGQ
jgi:hypothetical protein